MKFIIKGRIRDFVLWGRKGELRRGSYQFLPNTEVVLTASNLVYNPRLQNRFLIRGKGRSGLLTSKGVYFKYLNDLRIEEVINPSLETLGFIRKNDLLFFDEKRKKEYENWLEYFEEVSIAEPLTGNIVDETFLKAKAFVFKIQCLIESGKQQELLDRYFEYPIKVRHFDELKNEVVMDKYLFEQELGEYFLKDVCLSILKTELEAIFPTKTKMLIGKAEFSFNVITGFKITKIIYTNRYKTEPKDIYS